LCVCIHGHNSFVAGVESGVTFSRGDRSGYLAARGGAANDSESNDLLDPSYFKLLRKKLANPDIDQVTHDDPNECTMYLAESSIPNAGLGLYTTVPYQRHEIVGHSEIGILMQDPDFHARPNRNGIDLLSSYVWSATPLTFGEHEVGHGESVCPGIGMMSNCHFGLINVAHTSDWKKYYWQDGTDTLAVEGGKHSTLSDVGRGSFTWHGNVRYEAHKEIQIGEELFLSYGPQWYENSATDFGFLIPSAEHFKMADIGLINFMNSVADPSGMKFEDGVRNHRMTYQALLKKAEKYDARLRAALPDNVEDVPVAIDMGAARFSAKDSIRSAEWLKENGACLDNIVGGTSTIPQAGRGAFATRTIKEGGIITTTEVITIDKDALKLRKEVKRKDGITRSRHAGYQLMLNYCYGHRDSSLMFFPTSQSVNFINHGSKEDANAEIRWSSFPYHKSKWINYTLAEMKRINKAGLLFDVVATKDISRGDEILLYYGETWEENWDRHIGNWASSSKNFTDMKGVNTTVDFNRKNFVFRTEQEQIINPYPDHLMTRCGFELPSEMKSDYEVRDPQRVPCDILERDPIENTDRFFYRAKVEYTDKATNEVTFYSVKYDSRQSFLAFVDKPYTRDYYRKGAFRQYIGLGEGLIPSQWMDRMEE
ncbi:hypothetical protein ACHAW6_011961, partial [Cyclotella cf. meneghiniana]